MTADDTGRLIYLALLGIGIAGWFFIQGREGIGKTLQHAMVWGFLFVGVVAAYGLWNDIQRAASRDQISQIGTGQIAVPRQQNGHYYLTLLINDAPVRFVVDTGASEMVLTADDARRVGLDTSKLGYFGRANTANGMVRTAPVELGKVTLGDVTDTNVAAVVNEGEMRESLLGMGYLQRWGRIEIANGELILTR